MRRRKFIGLFGLVAAAWSVAAYAQGSATMPTTSGTTTSLPQIEVVRVKPVDQMPPNVRLSDDLIDLMKGFSLSNSHFPHDLARIIHNADARFLDRHVESSKIGHAALLLLMLEAASADLVSPSA